LIESRSVEAFCREARFQPGDVLREKGQHYRDMYLIADGSVVVDLETGRGGAGHILAGAGSPIGEIGFVQGLPGTATVRARSRVRALVIDDGTLARLEQRAPAVAAQLLRKLAAIAEERTSQNLILGSTKDAFASGRTIEVRLCRNKRMLEAAQRLRYEVYCQELGRQSPYADREKKIITDDLDVAGHTFVAVEDNEVIGTLRANVPSEGPLGVLEELYGMRASAHHPEATAVCTKFIVRKSRRRGPTSIKLISAAIKYGVRNSIKVVYIDCIPALLPYYKALGFTIAGDTFFHRENGPSHPMMLDLVKHGKRLSDERGVREYLRLIVKAQFFKLIDVVRGTEKATHAL